MAYTETAIREIASPGAATITSPRPTVAIRVEVVPNLYKQIRLQYTLTQGTTVVVGNILIGTNTGPADGSPRLGGAYTVSQIVNQDLPDGTWTLSVAGYTSLDNSYPNTGPITNTAGTKAFSSKASVAVTQLTPAVDAWAPAVISGGNYSQEFSWTFSSNAANDYPNSSTISIRRFSDQAVIINSTVQNSQATSRSIAIPDIYSEVQLEWQIAVSNRYGTVSPVSGWRKFGFGLPPVSTITVPTENQVLTSGVINYKTTAITSSALGSFGRNIKRIDASIWLGTDQVWSKSYEGSWDGGFNEGQTIGLGAATAGSVTITFQGQTTASIPWNASNATIKVALENLSNINPGDVNVSGSFPGVVTLMFQGQYRSSNVTQITATPSGLTGGTVTIATIYGGGGGQEVTLTDPDFPVLPQSVAGAPYQLRVSHIDTLDLQSAPAVRNYTVTYTAVSNPAAPTSSAVLYGTNGSVLIEWTNSGIDAQFYAYAVERRSIPLDPNTGAQTGTFSAWAEVGRVYQNNTNYDFYDYLAPANHYVEYRVRQIALRDGQQVMNPTPVAGGGVNIQSTSYWLVDTTLIESTAGATTTVHNGTAVQLHSVNSDDFTKERIRNEIVLIGRGRYIEQGDKVGVRGTLSAQVRDTIGSTARQKRLTLDEFLDLGVSCILRNPFGDSYTVSLGDIAVNRIPGTGKSEFVDISVPYVEVIS